MTIVKFNLKKISQFIICPSCGVAKHWKMFRRTQPGGLLPMQIYNECNLCSRVTQWFDSLPDESKDAYTINEEADKDLELKICEICHRERYGKYRSFFSKWVCDICYWRHCTGEIYIEKKG